MSRARHWINVRITTEQRAIAEAWRDWLQERTPGLTWTLARAIRGLILCHWGEPWDEMVEDVQSVMATSLWYLAGEDPSAEANVESMRAA